jgi:hypothetical protein
MSIPLTADFIRGLTGLSDAELTDAVIGELRVIEIAEAAALDYPTLSEHESLYYKGWKAVTLLAPSFYLAVAEKIQDNFNQFSRFENIQSLIDYAFSQVALIEGTSSEVPVFTIVSPDIDPVMGEGR